MEENKSRLDNGNFGGEKVTLRLVHKDPDGKENEEIEDILKEIGELLKQQKVKVNNPLEVECLSLVLRSTGYLSESQFNKVLDIIKKKRD